jgi:hypothetical protein
MKEDDFYIEQFLDGEEKAFEAISGNTKTGF